MFTREDLDKLKRLCHIECTEEEESRLLTNIQSILAQIDQLHEVNTDLTMGKHNVLDCSCNILQEDEIEPSLCIDEFLANTPEQVAGMVKVPLLIESL